MKKPTLLVGLSLAALALAPATYAAEDRGPVRSESLLVTEEQNCSESVIGRAVLLDRAQELLPEGYAVAVIPGSTAAPLAVLTYTCEQVLVDGAPKTGQQPVTVSIAGIGVSQRDGVALPAGDFYILWMGTDSAAFAAHLRKAGLPATFLKRTTVQIEDGAGTRTTGWEIRGSGLDYDVDVVAPEPEVLAPVPSQSGNWYYDAPEHDVALRWVNESQVFAGLTSADFTSNAFLPDLVVLPRLLTPTNVPFQYIRGSWTGEVVVLED